jgi:metal-responsive CopG/Arc/MetJ family transcriptional regulator
MLGLSALAIRHLDDDGCMEVTALKGLGGDVQHFADRISRAWRPLWPRGNEPNLG